jgi:23S rRNA (cytidine1920-2'-O)/16S rRNA (cytidine1409-2'-O)-methyltransferase
MKKRLDVLVYERGLAPSRELARRYILAGEVLVKGQVADKPGMTADEAADIELKAQARFVSRGGEKLAAALGAFSTQVEGALCADVGASTGGFTDCLLQHGAAKVYAIDVGYGQLAHKLREDGRVVVMERCNARHLESLPEPLGLVTIDASFISLRLLLPVVKAWLGPGGEVVALIKPQFEAGKAEADKAEGVIKDPRIHRRVLEEVLTTAQGLGYQARGLINSPLLGPKGNREFLAWLSLSGPGLATQDLIPPLFV